LCEAIEENAPFEVVSYLKRRGCPERFGYTAQVTKPGVLVLLALLAASPLVALLWHDTGSIRLLGLSLEWWYCGVVAPVVAVLIAVVATPRPASSPRRK
jgi:hypothetical protein